MPTTVFLPKVMGDWSISQQFRAPSSPNMHVFGLWDGIGAPKENPGPGIIQNYTEAVLTSVTSSCAVSFYLQAAIYVL